MGVYVIIEAERWGLGLWGDLYKRGGMLSIRDDDAFEEVSLEGRVANDRGDKV